MLLGIDFWILTVSCLLMIVVAGIASAVLHENFLSNPWQKDYGAANLAWDTLLTVGALALPVGTVYAFAQVFISSPWYLYAGPLGLGAVLGVVVVRKVGNPELIARNREAYLAEHLAQQPVALPRQMSGTAG